MFQDPKKLLMSLKRDCVMNLTIQNIVASPEKFRVRPTSFNTKSVLEKTATKIIEKFGDFNPVEPPDIDEIFLRVYEKLNNNDENISIKDLKLVASYIYRSGTEDACLLYTSPSPRDGLLSRMPSSA